MTDAINIDRSNWLRPENLRWALRHSRQVVPHAAIARGGGSPIPPSRGEPRELDDLTFTDAGREWRLVNFLAHSQADAFLVLHHGRIVYERWFHGMDAAQHHQWASMTKSINGLLAVTLAARGVIDLSKPVADYVPQLSQSPFGLATLQQNLDMVVAVDWPADVTETQWMMAVGLLPTAAGVPATIREFLPRVGRIATTPHGSAFRYLNSPAEAVAHAMCNATGQTWPVLVSQEIWSKLRMDQDATVIVDSEGTPQASGGFSSTPYDLARFAEALRCGSQVGSAEHWGSALSAGDPLRGAIASWVSPPPDRDDAVRRFAAGNIAGGRPGFSYRNGLFHVNDGDGSVQMSGRFGQRVHINPRAGLTVVQFASYAGPGEETAGAFLAAMNAITARLDS